MPLVVMKFVGAKYGNKNVKIILVKKCPYVVMKFVGGKSCQATYPQGSPLLYIITGKPLKILPSTGLQLSVLCIPNCCPPHFFHQAMEVPLRRTFDCLGGPKMEKICLISVYIWGIVVICIITLVVMIFEGIPVH